MLEIFQYTFMQRAFLAGTVLAIIAPLVGIFIVVRRFSALADTLSHVSLIGVSIALLARLNPINIALITSIVGGLGIEKLRANKRIYAESILALFISGSLGISSIIVSLSKSSTASISSYLFGSVNTVTAENINITLGIGVVTLIAVYFLYPLFFLVSLDEELAISKGLKVGILNTVLIVLAALVVSIGIQVVGVLLIGALMTIPVITAMQCKLSFKVTLYLSVAYSLVSVWLGLYMSYYLNLASGGAIVCVNLVFFGLSLLITRFN